MKVEKQTDDCFEPRKPKYFEKLLLFGKTIQQVSRWKRRKQNPETFR